MCLTAIQTARGRYPLVSVEDSRDIRIGRLKGVPIIAQYLVFKDDEGIYVPKNYTQATLYWYMRAQFDTGIAVEEKYVRTSLIIVSEDLDTYQELETTLRTFACRIIGYWEHL